MLKNRLDKRLQNIPAEIWLKINKIDELKGQWIAGAKLSPQVLGRLKRSVLITSTGASTRIEGAKLSDEDIEKIMRGISVQKFTDRDSQEVKGYFELLENVFNTWKNIKFSENTIKHFHQELLKYVDCLKLSEYEMNFITGHYSLEKSVLQILDAGPTITLITRGEEGSILGIKRKTNDIRIYQFPAYPTKKVVDETGAGDVFLYSFTSFLKEFNDPLKSMAFASSVSSLLIEKEGIDGRFSVRNILYRMREVYNNMLVIQ